MGWCLAIAIIATIIALILIVVLYRNNTIGWDSSSTCLVGKTTIVTGSNSGIGFNTAEDFAKRGARVILACRDPIRADEAKNNIIESTGNPNIAVKILDLSSLASIRAFALDINQTEESVDILVNNAGVAGFDHQLTVDGLSLIMQTNHFGPFLLTHLLIGMLKKSSPSRIVSVSSDLAYMASLNINDLNARPSGCFSKTVDYANTKLCNILFTNELARRLKGSGVEAYSIHPGAVQTGFFKSIPLPYRRFFEFIAKVFYKTSVEGAQTSIYASVSREVIGKSGQYFADCKEARMPRTAKDEELAKKLWEKSQEIVKLSPEERKLL